MTRSNPDDSADEENRNPDAVVAPIRPSDNRPSDAEVVGFLRAHYGADPTDLEVLGGGFWSAAYGYRIGGDELVLRINDEPDGFRDDEFAMRYGSPALPVPEVFAIGEGFGRWFAISRRHRGRFLEEVGPDQADALGPTVVELLAGLRAVPDTDIVTPAWRDWLLAGITDRPDHHTAGWRQRLAADATAEQTFRAVDRRIRSLLDACPDRREYSGLQFPGAANAFGHAPGVLPFSGEVQRRSLGRELLIPRKPRSSVQHLPHLVESEIELVRWLVFGSSSGHCVGPTNRADYHQCCADRGSRAGRAHTSAPRIPRFSATDPPHRGPSSALHSPA